MKYFLRQWLPVALASLAAWLLGYMIGRHFEDEWEEYLPEGYEENAGSSGEMCCK
jgi:hypothetical protein